MDALTKKLYKDYVHREIVRTYGQELSKSEMRKILKDCETLARNMTRRKHYVNWSFNCCISGWVCYTNNKNSLTAKEKINKMKIINIKTFSDKYNPNKKFYHIKLGNLEFRIETYPRKYKVSNRLFYSQKTGYVLNAFTKRYFRFITKWLMQTITIHKSLNACLTSV